MTGAAPWDIQIYKGDDFNLPFQLFDQTNTPVSLSGASINAKIRNAVADAAPIATFTGTITDGPNGIGNIAMPGATTALIPTNFDTEPGERDLTKYLWDAHITFADGTIFRIFEGFVYVDPQAST